MISTRWTFLAALAIGAALWLPGEAAQPVPPAGTAAQTAAAAPPRPAGETAEAITFQQYRDWRIEHLQRRRDDLAAQLAATGLPPGQRTRLEHAKAYYDWLAGLPEAERDRRFRERFDRIDTNHDNTIDAAERAAWRDSQRAFYRRGAAGRQAAARE
jgi:hypothetical protein